MTNTKTNIIYEGDCLEGLKLLEDNSVDLIITSPPYAMQRKNTYGGVSEAEYPEWMEKIAIQVKRVLKPSGHFVLNIKEHVKDGIRSTYVMETVLRISKILRWSDTFIWVKTNPFPTGSTKRLKDGFEYLHWFTKSDKYCLHPERVLVKSQSKYLESEKRRKNKGRHDCNNKSGLNMSTRVCNDFVRPSNVITMPSDTTNHKHPATFPLGIPDFFIKLMTDEDGLVVDIFAGSGTTLASARSHNRKYLGFEIQPDYVDIIKERVDGIEVVKIT